MNSSAGSVSDDTITPGVPSFMATSGMDGPEVSWTVADAVKPAGPRVALAYHVMGAGYDYMTPFGVAVGGIASLTPLIKSRSNMTPLQVMGTGGLVGGGIGMACGLAAMLRISKNPKKIPWTEEGIQQRMDGISHNFSIRVLDLGVWLGIATAGGALVAAGGPKNLGLSSGTLGVFQAVSLGSAAGSLASIGCVSATKAKDSLADGSE